MKLWHIAALAVGVGLVMVIVRSMQTKVGSNNQGASNNDVIVGVTGLGKSLIDLGGKLFAPSGGGVKPAPADPFYRDHAFMQPSAQGEDYIG